MDSINNIKVLMDLDFAAQIADVFRNDFRGVVQGRAQGSERTDRANDQKGCDGDPLKRQRSAAVFLFRVNGHFSLHPKLRNWHQSD